MTALNDKKIIIITGPSGAGKNAVIEKLIEKYPDTFEKVVSYTTRAMRPGEVAGVTYHYITNEEFRNKLSSGEIFEYTEIYGYFRGISKTLTDKIIKKGKVAIKDTDILGIHALRREYPGKVIVFFIDADKALLEQRLLARGDSEKDRIRKLGEYDQDITWKKYCDYIIDNNSSLDDCVKRVQDILWNKYLVKKKAKQ